MAGKVQGEARMEDVTSFVQREFNFQRSLIQSVNPNILKVISFSHRQRTTVPFFLGYLFLEWANLWQSP